LISNEELDGYLAEVTDTGLRETVLALALAVADQRLSAPEAWHLSRLDEHWQAEVWGRDEEAEMLEAARHEGFLHAERFYRFSS
jgi:chaperone required for assembly of F1-ATPase